MFHLANRFGTVFRFPFTVWLCLVLAVSLLTGCGSNQAQRAESSEQPQSVSTAADASATGANTPASSGERTVKDELGHEITVPAEPKRVFAPYLEDSLLKLGIKPVVQWSNGNMAHAYLQEELKDVPKLDFSGGLPSPEVIMSYNPDLIILHTATYAANGTYENYAKIAPTYVFQNASGDVEKSLVTLGELLGKSAEADQALKVYRQKVQEAKEKLDQAVGGKKVAIMRFAAKGVSLMGANYLCGNVVHQQLGVGKSKLVENANSANVTLETLSNLDADYIFVINAYGQGTQRMKEMTESSIWKSIPAVKQGHVYEVNDEYWLGSGLIAYEKIIDDTVKLLAK
ncbi:ABC transporter substrate-binding protein [Brevibacillus sp. MCWH]|jgi:iron complex transport system substrate-binding protein|uniref:ABC transporter substrate-binding protein n=1 Tax=Brevibacillus sp. MCWH TaxID=2508871 RepID=UPI0014920D63|nr:ABC transporter substrate-binding protein [Brevibacillus sp. MCWH]NNV02343.1 ABC transporter substrate-binding protein [Brevibacillus sp. MCWH]